MSRRTWVDDGEVWAEPDGDGIRIGSMSTESGDYISHHLTADDAATLAHALLPNPNPQATRALSWVLAACVAVIPVAATIALVRYLL